MKKILIALDFDPLAEKVAQTGYSIAKALGAEVQLLHVVDDPSVYSPIEYSPVMGFVGFTSPEMYNVADYLKNESRRFLEESRTHLGDENISINVAEGDFADSIITEAKAFGADLIVMGTHGRKGFDKMLMGNLADQVLHNSSIPVLAIPAPPENKN